MGQDVTRSIGDRQALSTQLIPASPHGDMWVPEATAAATGDPAELGQSLWDRTRWLWGHVCVQGAGQEPLCFTC